MWATTRAADGVALEALLSLHHHQVALEAVVAALESARGCVLAWRVHRSLSPPSPPPPLAMTMHERAWMATVAKAPLLLLLLVLLLLLLLLPPMSMASRPMSSRSPHAPH